MKVKQHKLLMQIYLPFVMFMVISMTLLNGATFHLLNQIRQQEYKENLTQTELTGNYLSNILNQSISLSRNLLFDTDLQEITQIGESKSANDYARIRTANLNFHKYSAVNHSDFSTNIFYVNSNVLISSEGSCSNLAYFYDKSYQFGNYTFEDLKKFADTVDYDTNFYAQQHFKIDGLTYDGFFYTMAFNTPIKTSQSKAFILSIIRKETIEEVFALFREKNGFSYITDRDGTLLFVSGNPTCEIKSYLPQEMKGYIPKGIYEDQYTVSYICLSEGINIYNVTPTSSIVQNTRMLTLIVLILNFACITICIIMAASIAQKRKKKLLQTFSMLELSDKKNSDYYDDINDGIAVLLNKNSHLSAKLSRDIFLLREEFWKKLLHNRFSSELELQEMAASADMDLKSDYFCLVILAIRDSGQALESEEKMHNPIRTYYDALSDYVEQQTSLHGYSYVLPFQQIVLLLRLSPSDAAHYQAFIKNMLLPFPNSINPDQTCCVASRLMESAISIGDEYAYCSNILLQHYDDLISEGERIVWSESGYTHSDVLNFPRRLSDQMIASIQAGETERISDYFQEIFTSNFNSEHAITPAMSTLLLTRLKLVVLEAYQKEMDFDIHKSLRQIDELPFDALKINYFINLTNKMCLFYKKNIDDKTNKLKKKIIDYIQKNFTSPTFSLTEVATYCGFRDSYFSLLFREIIGINFSVYVEQKKMELADQLLQETNMKIDEIASQIGYSDTNAFRRSYKKYFSVSPSQRRSGLTDK